jgi:shikimate kinase
MGIAVARPRPATVARPTVIELVGPAGAGKSSVMAVLRRGHPRIRTDLSLWGLPRTRLLTCLPPLVPTLARAAWARRPLSAAEAAQMVRADALERTVAGALQPTHQAIVLDEGAVFALAWMEVFFGRPGSVARAQWRRHALARWAAHLDAVVWLDAEDATLARRIRARAKPHLVKRWSDADILCFTERFRRAFERAVSHLTAVGGVVVERVPTDERSPAETADQVLELVERLRHGR